MLSIAVKYLKEKFWLAVIALVTLFPACLSAQSIEFSASCDKTVVALGESFTLTVTVSGDVAKVPSPELPELKDFEIYSSGRNQSFSYVNGKVSSSINYTYRIVPRSIGKFTIPPISLQYRDTKLQTDSIHIEVIREKQISPTQKGKPEEPEEGAPSIQGKKDLFATVSLNKQKAYVGEQVIYVFRFFQGVQLLSAPQYTPPDFSGFWAEKLSEDTGYRTIEGRQYYVYEVKYALFPVAPGEKSIPSTSIACHIDDFFSRPLSLGGRKEIVQTNPVSLEVIPLPHDVIPQSFTGGVGQFDVKSSVDKAIANQNEPVIFCFRVSGSGNFKGIDMPNFEIAGDVKIYEPKSSIKVEEDRSVLRGSKIFEVMLVPATVGAFKIPSIEFSYFEPNSQRYVTQKTDPIGITVNPAKIPQAPSDQGIFLREEVKSEGKDIRFIKTDFVLHGKRPLLIDSKIFLSIHLLPALCFFILLWLKQWRDRLSRDIGYARARSAPSNLKKGLKICEESKDSPEDFYSNLSRTIKNYIGDKLNISTPGLTKDGIAGTLRKKIIDESVVTSLFDLLERCEQARFGMGSFKSENIEEDLERAKDILRHLSKRRF